MVRVILDTSDLLAPLDLWRCSPLHRAAELGREEVFLHLLKQKADPQKAWARWTSAASLRPTAMATRLCTGHAPQVRSH